MHLTVISYPSIISDLFEDVAFTFNPSAHSPKSAFVRCQHPNHLPHVLANIGQKVTCLDLFGHGDSGRLKLGDGMLVDTDRTNWDVIRQLDEVLAEGAKVRLLGCFTGTCHAGHKTLRDIAGRLGKNREILGTTALIYQRDFGPTGFKEEVAQKYLVSSNIPHPVEPASRFGGGPEPTLGEDKFIKSLPQGFIAQGRGVPSAIPMDQKIVDSTEVSLASEGKLVLLRDLSQQQPLLFLFKKCPPVLDVPKLRSALRLS
ncbi:DUF4347 domain-containing protein [Hyalangium rubrum]|uniref:DUF4347 domain-containing protein n=1 Tax=Hyalangium rubrum TaxID=3103134 RepID=A0ABU5H1H1_9BACT|nr:DUF4347 domain-containing protein [Hyalangium sp. s54d21]MDY7226957.1 DUF4347 domain-containing protein [Hyalangium sp. s54d21]